MGKIKVVEIIEHQHETLILEDPHALGFLNLPQYNFKIKFERNWSGRVNGIIVADPIALKAAFDDLQNNVSVGAKDLIESIKEVRRMIFTIKNNQK